MCLARLTAALRWLPCCFGAHLAVSLFLSCIFLEISAAETRLRGHELRKPRAERSESATRPNLHRLGESKPTPAAFPTHLSASSKHETARLDPFEYNHSTVNASLKLGADAQASTKIQTIMLWNGMWHHPRWVWPKLGTEPFSACPETRCSLSARQESVAGFDAVLVHGRDSVDRMPPREPANQVRAYVLMESPEHLNPYDAANAATAAGGFNWTITYRRDSDIVIPYGSTRRLRPGEPAITPAGFNQRNFNQSIFKALPPPAPAVWIASDCDAEDGRIDVVAQLRESGFQVDVFGACGSPHPCPRHDHQCNSVFMSRYAFVLAFESSRCRDYVTEKFWQSVQTDAVPVVMGPSRKDMEAVSPPKSFVHLDDFANVQEAAVTLKHLAADRPALMSRFKEWKGDYAVEIDGFSSKRWLCDLCAGLHSQDQAPRIGQTKLLDKVGLLQFLYGHDTCNPHDGERDVFMWKNWKGIVR